MQTKADVVIIGSGMGGLACGVILAKAGLKVVVLEKNHQVGGSLQVFSREKRIFDTGVHYVGGLQENGNLNLFFKYLGILDEIKLKKLDEEGFDLLRFPDGKKYRYGQGYDCFKRLLYEEFPQEKAGIDLFCEKMVEICKLFPLYNLEQPTADAYFTQTEVLESKAVDLISSCTHDERLQNVLAGTNPLYAGERDKTPFFVHALILNSYIEGSYRVVNGGANIAKALVRKLYSMGGVVVKHSEVVGAEYLENGHIKSVVTSDGSQYHANHFISNVHPSNTIDIFGENKFLKAYVRRIKGLRNTISVFIVNLVIKPKSFKYLNYNTYEFFTNDVWSGVDYHESNWPPGLFVSMTSTTKDPEFADAISVMAYMRYEEVEQWSKTHNTVLNKGERGEDYESFKKEKEAKVVNRLLERFPDLEGKIDSVYSSSPLTFRDYIGTQDGSLYGILKDANSPHQSVINSKMRIPNLYLTGQNLIFHGILGVTIGAFVTAFHFVDQQKVLDEINALRS